jgi:hypothetical protein
LEEDEGTGVGSDCRAAHVSSRKFSANERWEKRFQRVRNQLRLNLISQLCAFTPSIPTYSADKYRWGLFNGGQASGYHVKLSKSKLTQIYHMKSFNGSISLRHFFFEQFGYEDLVCLSLSSASVALSFSFWTFNLRNAGNGVRVVGSQSLDSVAPGNDLLPCS